MYIFLVILSICQASIFCKFSIVCHFLVYEYGHFFLKMKINYIKSYYATKIVCTKKLISAFLLLNVHYNDRVFEDGSVH